MIYLIETERRPLPAVRITIGPLAVIVRIASCSTCCEFLWVAATSADRVSCRVAVTVGAAQTHAVPVVWCVGGAREIVVGYYAGLVRYDALATAHQPIHTVFVLAICHVFGGPFLEPAPETGRFPLGDGWMGLQQNTRPVLIWFWGGASTKTH